MEAVVTVDAVETGEEIEEDVVIEGPVVVVEEEAEEEEGVVARELIQTMLMHFHHYDREKSRGEIWRGPFRESMGVTLAFATTPVCRLYLSCRIHISESQSTLETKGVREFTMW